MDGIPLLERRLKTLSSILPIIDEGSEQIINDRTLNALLGRNDWLFYLDYGWVDQHIIHVNNKASYHYEPKVINEEDKYIIGAELRRRNLLGNYIWLSDSARKQLELESPHLSRVVIPVELNVATRKSDIIFLMKFEDIIPRLQRYYLLDQTRDVLQDIPQNKDSKRLCNLIELQLSQEFDVHKSKEIIDSIKSFPWYGYKAKDAALNLLLTLHKKTDDHINKLIVEQKQKDYLKSEFKTHFIDTINDIGYPSQYLHAAQLSKLITRDRKNILEIAKNMQHKNFYDAWLYLSSTPGEGQEKDLLDMVHFLNSVPTMRWTERTHFIRMKAIATLNQLPRRFSIKHKSKIEECLNTYYRWVLSNLNMESLYWLLDVHLHLMQLTKIDLRLETDILKELQHLESFNATPGSQEEMMKLGFTSRLQKVLNFDENVKNQAPVAFFSETA
jgi:hypothetical protein